MKQKMRVAYENLDPFNCLMDVYSADFYNAGGVSSFIAHSLHTVGPQQRADFYFQFNHSYSLFVFSTTYKCMVDILK